jgi:hypothetical protein
MAQRAYGLSTPSCPMIRVFQDYCNISRCYDTHHPISPRADHFIVLSCVQFSDEKQYKMDRESAYELCATMIRLRLGKALSLVSLLCATIFSSSVVASYPSPGSLIEKRLEAVKRWETSAHQAGARDHHARGATEKSTPLGVKNITFSNLKASGAFCQASRVVRLFSHIAFRVLRGWWKPSRSGL